MTQHGASNRQASRPSDDSVPIGSAQSRDELVENLRRVWQLGQEISSELARRGDALQSAPGGVNLVNAYMEAATAWWRSPSSVLAEQFRLWQEHLELWSELTPFGAPDTETLRPRTPATRDRRFRDPQWESHPVFDFVRRSYLIFAGAIERQVEALEGLDRHTADKVAFYTRQFIDALAPSNFVLTNPEVFRATMDSSGANLVRGMRQMLTDLQCSGDGGLATAMTDMEAFRVGENIATTPGKVVYQNELMQLIQYAPMTEMVFRRPLLIVPPWINKYYILDMRPENSFIRWCVAQGHTVFVISWVNPDGRLAEKSFRDYLFEGPLAALDAIERATGERDVDAIGYCVGGTLMAVLLAYLAAIGDERVRSCTLLATQVDFSEPGDLGVFIDEDQIAYLETRMAANGGFLDSSAMATTFNLLRANDLIWSFVVNNYLLGQNPAPFDLLYWNADATRLPAALHSFYLRNMYLENRLAVPGGIQIDGIPIDLSRIRVPLYMQAAREDHIAPYRSVFKGAGFFGAPPRLLLAGSGHIAGVVNHPDARKYQYWTQDSDDERCDPQSWLASATEAPGSWWPHWHDWLASQPQDQVPPRWPGDRGLEATEDAPGSYVRVRS